MSKEIKFLKKETFTFDEVEFLSTGKKIKNLEISGMSYSDRQIMIDKLSDSPSTKEITAAMFDLVCRKTGLKESEVMELPEPIYNAVVNFLNPS